MASATSAPRSTLTARSLGCTSETWYSAVQTATTSTLNASPEFQRAQLRYNPEHPDEPIPVIGLHGLRHGWATLALEAGIPMKVVQDRLNHSSDRITADIYTHVRRPLQSDAAHRVAELIRSPAPKQVE